MTIDITQSKLYEYWLYHPNTLLPVHRGLCDAPEGIVDYLSANDYPLDIKDVHNLYEYNDHFIKVKTGTTIVFEGVISSYETQTRITMKSILDYLDYPINEYIFKEQEIEWSSYLKNMLEVQYKTNTDTIMNIDAIKVVSSGKSTSKYVKESYGVNTFSELRKWCFKKHNIIIKPSINSGELGIDIFENVNNAININIGMHDLVSIDNIDFTIPLNKIRFYDRDTNTFAGQYYLLNDGTLTQDHNDPKRITPVIEEIAFIGPDDDKLEYAQSNLLEYQHQEELNFEFRNNSKLIDTNTINIGDPITIIYNGTNKIKTIITGNQRMPLTTKFKCGLNRNTLENYLKGIK